MAEERWKRLPDDGRLIGESWETELSTLVQNGPYAGRSLGELVALLGANLLGQDALAVFGARFPLLAKFIDARTDLSVQVHPGDDYAALREGGKLGKTECWYILATEPGASIIHGFRAPGTRAEVQRAIAEARLEELMHKEPVSPGDVIFVPAGTVHAIGGGILLYELQEYSDVTYRMYDYGRLDARGLPRALHIERSLDVARYSPSASIKARAVTLSETADYTERCLVASRYFVEREFVLRTRLHAQTSGSCVILTSLGAALRVFYGADLALSEPLMRGETMVLPAALGAYRVEGNGAFLSSSVPSTDAAAWHLWREQNA